jgi:hypothetical protein
VLGLSGLQKVTARLIEGVDIQHSSSTFSVSFVTVVPFFRVSEEVPLDASGSSQLGRRDLRWGQATAAAVTTPEGGVRVDMSWGAPMEGARLGLGVGARACVRVRCSGHRCVAPARRALLLRPLAALDEAMCMFQHTACLRECLALTLCV